MNVVASDGFRKWTPINSHYVDPADLRAAQIAQSAATRNGKVAAFAIPDCPQPETSLRTRAWTAEQMANLKKESK